jgi:4-hydroxy-tetrahydrodipicolinate reductase
MTRPKLAIVGLGKMGRAVDELAAAHGFDVVARLGREGGSAARIDGAALHGADVAIEFTEPSAAPANVRALIAAGCPVVTGTTGWADQLPAVIREVERAGGAMIWESNFSPGAQMLLALLATAATSLARAPDSFAPHIIETHHAAKKDAPSGTARTLAERGEALGVKMPITSVRVGNVPGTHEIVLDAPYEQIRIEHVVRDRRVFASGALLAARWLIGKRGVFRMSDVTGAGQRS